MLVRKYMKIIYVHVSSTAVHIYDFHLFTVVYSLYLFHETFSMFVVYESTFSAAICICRGSNCRNWDDNK